MKVFLGTCFKNFNSDRLKLGLARDEPLGLHCSDNFLHVVDFLCFTKIIEMLSQLVVYFGCFTKIIAPLR